MDFLEALKKYAATIPAELSEKKGTWTFAFFIAERKAFLSKKKLQYIARIRVDDQHREVAFSEMLKESGSGFSAGSGGEEISGGFGFKKEVYRSDGQRREGTMEEQSRFFGKDYTFRFDYQGVRTTVERLARMAGYTFTYRIHL